MPVFRVPHYQSLLHSTSRWKIGPEGTQSVEPLGQLHDKIGIEPGSQVLFFAGSYGDWAHGLAQTTQVHYTDASREMVDHAKKRFEGKGIKRFSTVDAVHWPNSRNYDYLVSYEPVPLAKGQLPIITLRALANTKGIRVIASEASLGAPLDYRGMLGEGIGVKMARLYDAKRRLYTRLIRCIGATPYWLPKKEAIAENFHVIEINSNEETRKKAKLDLSVISALQKERETSLSDLRKILKKKGVDVSLAQLALSLRRIHRISQFMDAETTAERKVNIF